MGEGIEPIVFGQADQPMPAPELKLAPVEKLPGSRNAHHHRESIRWAQVMRSDHDSGNRTQRDGYGDELHVAPFDSHIYGYSKLARARGSWT